MTGKRKQRGLSRRMVRFLKQFPKVKAIMREGLDLRPMDYFIDIETGAACGCIFRDGGFTDTNCCLNGHNKALAAGGK